MAYAISDKISLLAYKHITLNDANISVRYSGWYMISFMHVYVCAGFMLAMDIVAQCKDIILGQKY